MTDTPKPADHSEEDVITKLLVGFANDLLAYENRMDKTGSDTLFIHNYVSRRKRRFDSLIATAIAAAVQAERDALLASMEPKPHRPDCNSVEWQDGGCSCGVLPYNEGLGKAITIITNGQNIRCNR